MITQYTVYVKTINQNTDTVVDIGQAVSNIDTSTTFANATLEAAGVEVITGTGNYVPKLTLTFPLTLSGSPRTTSSRTPVTVLS